MAGKQSVIAVIGAGLPGLAAAARLAKVGHQVAIIEQAPLIPSARVATEPGEEVFTLPAAWRDLFRKSGRVLEAELARHQLSLSAAPARHFRFADGSGLDLPSGRGEQWTVLAEMYGEQVAIRWRDLLDRLDDSWQLVRRLGVEAELVADRQLTGLRQALRVRQSLAGLAATAPNPPLTEVVLDVAARIGQDPRHYPGWQAFRLSLERTFGRWQVTDAAGTAQPAELLLRLLVDRLTTRTVSVYTDVAVTRIRRAGAGLELQTTAGPTTVDAAISTVDPWTQAELTGERADYRLARRLQPTPSGGPRWTSWRTLLDLPRLQSPVPRLLTASAWSPAGPDSWAQLLTGALAAYRLHEQLTGEDIRPTNRGRTSES